MSSSPPNYAASSSANTDLSNPKEKGTLPSEHDITVLPNEVHQNATGGVVTTETYISETQRAAQAGHLSFRFASLWEPSIINPVNGKSYTLPILRIWDPYSIAFWMATLGFFSAFFSWFAFAPLMTEAVKKDLNLTNSRMLTTTITSILLLTTFSEVTYSNLASLGGTAIVRIFAGPAVDRYGPRKVMATLLCLGAIPSALVPTVSSIGGLETVRFFISFLGGTFVPTQAWTTAFFDKTIVGTANAFSGGWGNLGGGVTPSVMIGLYEGLHKRGLSPHLAWRICFLVMPVPLLFFVAALMMLIAKDHPAGKWSQRHQLPGTAIAIGRGEDVHLDSSERQQYEGHEDSRQEKGPMKTSDFREVASDATQLTSIDIAVSEPLTVQAAIAVVKDLRVWMVALSYLITFGLETSLDAALPTLLNQLFASQSFTSIDAAYVASTYGLCNLYARPLGGIACDILYRRFEGRGLGVRAKVVFLLITAIAQGLFLVGLGVYIDHGKASLGGVIGFMVALATTGFAANGAAYAIYGHLRPRNNGTVAGIVGACGNIGGLIFTGIYLHQPGTKADRTLGRKFWIAGILNVAVLLPFSFVPMGNAK